MEKELYHDFIFADEIEARLSQIQSGALVKTEKGKQILPEVSLIKIDEIDSVFSQVEQIAALSGTFNPHSLLPAQTDLTIKNEVLKLLEIYCSIQKDRDQVSWILSHSRRTTVLREMFNTGRFSTFDRSTLPQTDLMGHFIRKILFKEIIDPKSLAQEELLALSAAIENLGELPDIPQPDPIEVKKLITTKNFIDEYESMLKDGFVGRTTPLHELKDFIAFPSTGFSGIFLTGTGGSGKTTLLAKLVQDIVKESLATISILDFDKPGIDPYDDYWREQEITRHIGYQYPEIKNDLHLARVAFREARRQDFQPNFKSNVQSQSRSYSEILSVIPNALEKVRADTKPLIIILDTFEVAVQQKAVEKLFDWCNTVIDKLYRLRVKFIYSGRALDTVSFSQFSFASKFKFIELKEFIDSETAEYLAKQHVNPQIIPQIVQSKLLPHRPLELKLLARVINNGDATVEQLRNEFIHTRKSARHLFLGLVYKRVLDRIDDKNVKKLAYPGLVLRYITVDLVEKVLMRALRIKDENFSPSKVLEGLANYGWLATRGDNGEVYHRKDLRRTMLRLIYAREPKRAARISEAAIKYFTDLYEKTKKEEAEILYHRLLLTDTPSKTNDFNLAQLKSLSIHLSTDAEDFPRPAQVLLEYVTNGKVALEDFHLLPDKEILKAYDETGNRLTTMNNYLKAYHLYKRFARKKEFIGQRRDWEVDALIETGNWSELKHLDPAGFLFGTQRDMDPTVLLVYSGIFSLPTKRKVKAFENRLDDWLNSMTKSKRTVNTPSEVIAISHLIDFFIFYENQFTQIKKKKELLVSMTKKTRPMFFTDVPLPLQRSLLRLDRIGFFKEQKKLYLHSTQIKLDPSWIEKVQSKFKESSTSKSGHKLLAALQTNLTGNVYRQKSSVKNLLSILDSEKTRGEKSNAYVAIDDIRIPGSFLRGPDPEFRNPVRYAILESFRSKSDLRKLLRVIKKNSFVLTDDMKEELFLENITANPEEALLPFIELVDRSWKLKSFVIDCLMIKPQAKKLRTIKSVYVKWDAQINKRLR
jgi:hypothetical protein